MTRRAIGLFVTLALALLLAPPTTEAQMPTKAPKVAILSPASLPRPSSPTVSFSQGMHDRGDVEGQTVLMPYYYAAGQLDRPPRLAAELVQLRPEVIVTCSALGALAAK
jgi:putative ABC transport system substrate-binding protein